MNITPTKTQSKCRLDGDFEINAPATRKIMIEVTKNKRRDDEFDLFLRFNNVNRIPHCFLNTLFVALCLQLQTFLN